MYQQQWVIIYYAIPSYNMTTTLAGSEHVLYTLFASSRTGTDSPLSSTTFWCTSLNHWYYRSTINIQWNIPACCTYFQNRVKGYLSVVMERVKPLNNNIIVVEATQALFIVIWPAILPYRESIHNPINYATCLPRILTLSRTWTAVCFWLLIWQLCTMSINSLSR